MEAMMLLSEVQHCDRQCERQKTGCQRCMSICSSGDERLSLASTAISRQYVQYKRRRKRNMVADERRTAHWLPSSSRNCISSCCKRQRADKSPSHLADGQHQAKDQIKLQEQDRTFFLSLINQSFSIFYNYCDYHLHSRASSGSSGAAELRPRNQLRNKFNRFRTKFKFRFKSVRLILLLIFASLNCVLASEHSQAFNLLGAAESGNSLQSLASSHSIRPPVPTVAVNSSFGPANFTDKQPDFLNSSAVSPYSSLDFISNLLPSTELFSFNFYSTSPSHHPTIDQSTTSLPNSTESPSPRHFSSNADSIDHNQTQSAHFESTNNHAFQTKFNQPKRPNETPQRWPYRSLEIQNFSKTNYKFNWTDRFKKAIDSSWSSSTVSDQFANNHSSLAQSLADSTSPSPSSQLIHLVPTPSPLIANLSDPHIMGANNSEASNNATANDSTANPDFAEDTSFAGKFLQPFTNLSWWTAVPFPKSGYHNYSIVFLAFFITIVMLIVVIGNLLVCIAICTEKSLKTIQNWFIASLAVSDLLLGLIIMPFSLAYELMGTWVFSDLWCDFHHALDVLLTTASINNLCLISLDRYWSVTQAIEYLKKRTPCRAIFMIIFAWVFSALVSIPPLIGWKPETQIPGECTLSNDLGYVLYSSLGSFYIPSVVMVFVYAKIFIAARSRARKHVRKKQVSGGSSVQEPKKTSSQISKAIPQPPPASTSSQDNATSYAKQPVTTSASPPASQQPEDKKEEPRSDGGLPRSESKGSTKGRAPYGRFTRRAQLGINNDQADLEESSETEANQQAVQSVSQQQAAQQQQAKPDQAVTLHTVSNQTTNTESSSGIGTGEEHQLNSVPTSGSSVQTEPASTDAKGANFPCTRTFTYDHLFVEDRKSAPAGEKSQSESVVGRPSTPSSKVTFSPNDIVFDLNASGTQSVSMVPQIVIHGSMQQLHLQTSAKRARFSVNKLKDSDFNNNQANEKRLLTGTLSAGQLDCVILEQREGLKDGSKDEPKRSSIKRSKYQNELEIDCTAAQELNQQQTVGSPHSILKPTSSNTSPTAINKSEQQQIELKEKTHSTVPHPSVKPTESILSAASSNVNGRSKEGSSHVSPVSRTFSEQTANSVRQDGKLNHLGVSSLQTAASISGSMMSINYDYDSETYMDEKSSKRGFEDDEFDFDDENESSNTHDENASKRSVKSNLRQSKKRNLFNRWSWCKKWLWLNEKCASNQEEEFAGYEDDEEEEDEELDQMGSSIKSGGDRHPAKKGGAKRILKKNRNKAAYNASIISANNTSSSGTQSGTAQQPDRKLAEKKSSSLFSRFSRDNSNKSTSSGSAKRSAGSKQQRSAKSTCSVAAISQSSQTGRHRKHRHKSDGQMHAHSSSTAESGVATQYRFQASEADRQKRKVAKAREKRATLILGLIMGAFILGYIPFSTMYLIQGICSTCQIQSALTVTYWIGYTASAINPVIYTVFNRDFRKAFKKIVFR